MRKEVRVLLLLICLMLSVSIVPAEGKFNPDKYHSPTEVQTILQKFSSDFPGLTKLISIGKTERNRDLSVLQVAAKGNGTAPIEGRPAIFISANIEGVHLSGTEAALFLADKLLTGYKQDKKITEILENRTIYVAPLLNPDAAAAFFNQPRLEKRSNDKPVDDDLDDLFDEDGPEDLNRDGLITQMRVKDPEGTYLPDPKEPRLLRKASAKDGEVGIYKVYTEGLDNDGDGEINEDPAGGIELNRNFPHDFEYNLPQTGRWPVSAKETIALLEFLFDHSNIALVLNFSHENTFLNLQQTGKAKASGNKVKVPKNFASFLGVDPEQEFTIPELVEIIKSSGIAPPGMEITEEIVAMFLGLGAAVEIDKQDLPFFQAIQKEYKDKLKEAKLNYPQNRAKGVGKGSFVPFCYFQFGVPVFSTDLWAVPEPKKEAKKDELSVEKLKSMSSEEFLKLPDETISAFLKAQGAPPNFNPEMIKKMVESGRVTPEKMAEMVESMPKKPGGDRKEHPEAYILKWADKELGGKGFVDWKPFKHPTLGDVEIGGFAPFIKIDPPIDQLQATLKFHSDIYLDLMGRLAEITFKDILVKKLSDEVYSVTAYIANIGWFPTATAQGRRAGTSWPVRIKLNTAKGQTIFSGRAIQTIPSIGGSGETKKLEWTIKGEKGSEVTITAESPKLNKISATIVLE